MQRTHPLLLSLSIGLAFGLSASAAELSVKLSDVHLCCQSSVKAVQAAVAGVSGVTAAADKDAGTVTLTGPDKATVQKAADSLVAAGYFGKSSDASIQMRPHSGATGQK